MGRKRNSWDNLGRKKRVGQYHRISQSEGPASSKTRRKRPAAKRKQKAGHVKSGHVASRTFGEDFFEYKGIKLDTAYLQKGKLIHIRDFLKLRAVKAKTATEKAALVREFNKVIKRDYYRLMSLIQRDGTKKVSIGRRQGTYFVEYTVVTANKRA
jgi:hypothetical protein